MSTRDFEGRSAAEAAIKACDELDVSRSALKYEVVEQSGEGLDARVLIRVDVATSEANRSEAPPARERSRDDDRGDSDRDRGDRGDRGGRDRDRGGRGGRSGGGRDRGERGSGRGGRGGRSGGGGGRDGARGGRDGARGGRGGRGGRDGGRDRGGRGGRRGGGRDRDRGGAMQRPPDDDGLEKMLNLEIIPSEPVVERPAVEGDITERATIASTIVKELIEEMGLAITSSLVQDSDEIHIDMSGDDAARVIGKKGEALLAMQFLVNRIVSRKAEGGDEHIVLDALGYRARRRAALEDLARKLAERAIEEQKVVRLSPMSAHDRRIFHLTLEKMDDVGTRSEGSGLYRPLLIIPGEE